MIKELFWISYYWSEVVLEPPSTYTIVEISTSDELYENPLHPYSKALLSAVPIAEPFIDEKRSRIILKGEVPSPLNPPTGCVFNPRCNLATDDCSRMLPPLRKVDSNHLVAFFKVKGS